MLRSRARRIPRFGGRYRDVFDAETSPIHASRPLVRGPERLAENAGPMTTDGGSGRRRDGDPRGVTAAPGRRRRGGACAASAWRLAALVRVRRAVHRASHMRAGMTFLQVLQESIAQACFV